MAPAEHTTMSEGPYQMMLAQIANQKMQRYKQTTVPMQELYLKNARNAGSPQQIQQAANLATSGLAARTAPAINNATQGAIQAGGMNPMQQLRMREAAATAGGQAGLGARIGQKDNSLRMLGNYVGMGQGQSTLAQASMTDVAANSQRQAESQALRDYQNSQGLGSALGTAAGYGLGSYINSKG